MVKVIGYRLLVIGVILLSPLTSHLSPLYAQEINCSVTVNSDAIEGSNKQVFETLKQAIEEYMNQNRWTNMTYAEKEKIECSMLLVVKAYQDNMFACEMTLQSRRPVYGTSYTTPLLMSTSRTSSQRT